MIQYVKYYTPIPNPTRLILIGLRVINKLRGTIQLENNFTMFGSIIKGTVIVLSC